MTTIGGGASFGGGGASAPPEPTMVELSSTFTHGGSGPQLIPYDEFRHGDPDPFDPSSNLYRVPEDRWYYVQVSLSYPSLTPDRVTFDIGSQAGPYRYASRHFVEAGKPVAKVSSIRPIYADEDLRVRVNCPTETDASPDTQSHLLVRPLDKLRGDYTSAGFGLGI